MLQEITEGLWGNQQAKINQMIEELAGHAVIPFTHVWEDWWAINHHILNNNLEALYEAFNGEGREAFIFQESWGSVRGKMNTMFPYLYELVESEVEFEVTGSPPIGGVGINVSYYLNYMSSTVTDISPSSVTFSSNYFTIPLGVDEFTFNDNGVPMEAVDFGGWSISEAES